MVTAHRHCRPAYQARPGPVRLQGGSGARRSLQATGRQDRARGLVLDRLELVDRLLQPEVARVVDQAVPVRQIQGTDAFCIGLLRACESRHAECSLHSGLDAEPLHLERYERGEHVLKTLVGLLGLTRCRLFSLAIDLQRPRDHDAKGCDPSRRLGTPGRPQH